MRSRPRARSFQPLRKPARLWVAVALAAGALLAAGCGAVGRVTSGDTAHGKQLFVKTCGTCHTLANAGTKGTIGPNLDDAFAAPKSDQFASSGTEQTIRDIVRGQIAYAEADPGTTHPGMPPDLLHGQDARDVAAYVAKCSAVPKCNAG